MRAFHDKIANLDAIKAYYAGETEGLKLAFKPKA
jgi:hypothetical protein